MIKTLQRAVVKKVVNDVGNVDWASLPQCLKGDSSFVGINRNNLAAQASEWIEFTITKSSCSPADAEAILLLALTSANESEGIIYLFDAGSTAELMNLPGDILSVIPLYAAGIANDLQGDKPAGLWAWVVQLVTNPLQALWGLICAIGEWLGKLIEAIVEAGMRLVEAIDPGAMALIEAAVKAIILVLAYILIAFTLFFAIIGFLLMIPAFSILCIVKGLEMTIGFLYLSLKREDDTLEYVVSIDWLFVPIIDMSLPFLSTGMLYNGLIVSKNLEPLMMGESFLISEYEEEDLYNSETFASSISLSETETTNSEEESEPSEGEVFLSNFWLGFGMAFAILSVIIAGFTLAHELQNTAQQNAVKVIFWLVLVLFVFNCIILIHNLEFKELETSLGQMSFIFGVAMAMMSIGGLLMVAFAGEMEDFWKYAENAGFWIITTLEFIRIFLDMLAIVHDIGLINWELLEYNLWVQLSIFGVIILLAHFFTKEQDLRKHFFLLGSVSLILGMVIFALFPTLTIPTLLLIIVMGVIFATLIFRRMRS